MLAINCRPSDTGFWYKVSAPQDSLFSAEFIAIGTSGHQTAGELGGRVCETDEWLYQPVHFPVMHAAVTRFCLLGTAALERNPMHSVLSNRAESTFIRSGPAGQEARPIMAAIEAPYNFEASTFTAGAEGPYNWKDTDDQVSSGQLRDAVLAAPNSAGHVEGPYSFVAPDWPNGGRAPLPIMTASEGGPYSFSGSDAELGQLRLSPVANPVMPGIATAPGESPASR